MLSRGDVTLINADKKCCFAKLARNKNTVSARALERPAAGEKLPLLLLRFPLITLNKRQVIPELSVTHHEDL
ncbi:hypothetical protein KOW79_006861 [Hemibagrus wyckioides]|uniref:Uncharacterized protein n=1 Tax=Hemibagrus wyckioides TaxID=337641 RepID=A0A9D3NY22_9TELE|nr:hypothetical protein KOW79_006861 [Hemibagrus wyckioides]